MKIIIYVYIYNSCLCINTHDLYAFVFLMTNNKEWLKKDSNIFTFWFKYFWGGGVSKINPDTFRDYGFWGTLAFLSGFILAGVLHSESEVDESLYSTKLKILGLEYDTPGLLILCILFAFFLQLTLQYRRIEGLNKFNQASSAIDKIKLNERNKLDKKIVNFVKIYDAIRFDMKQTVLWIVSFLFLVSQNIWIIISIFLGAWIGESIAFIHLIMVKIAEEKDGEKPLSSGELQNELLEVMTLKNHFRF